MHYQVISLPYLNYYKVHLCFLGMHWELVEKDTLITHYPEPHFCPGVWWHLAFQIFPR